MGKESAFGALLFCPIGGPVEAAAGYNLRGGFPPGPGRGSRLSLEKARTQRVAGGGPPPPLFLWPARSHSLVLGLGDALFRLCAYFEPHVRALIWGLSFAKFFFSIFFPENASQIGLRISEEIAPLPYQRQRSPKRASGSKRAIKLGVQGRSPGPLSPHFSGEMGTPAGQAGQRGAAPQGQLRSGPPRGYVLGLLQHPHPNAKEATAWNSPNI